MMMAALGGRPHKDIEALPLSALIIGRADGTFEMLHDFEPGAVEAELLYVREGDDLEVVDVVAWECHAPSRWWLLRQLVTFIGEHELEAAEWEDRPARMVATPRDFIHCQESSFVVLDWSVDILSIVGRAPKIECATAALAAKLRATLLEQAMPKIPVSVRRH